MRQSRSVRIPTGRRTSLRAAATVLLLLGASSAGCAAFKRCAYEGVGRDRWQKPEEVVAALELRPGTRVADLGSGSGYFTFRLADAVGPQGRVWAVDIDEGSNRVLEERARREGYAMLEVVLAEPDDPRLPGGLVDLVFISNTYHHLRDRPAYFARVRDALAPGGRVAVIEYDGSSFFARLFGHRTASEEIVTQMQQAGFRLALEHHFLPRQSFLVFEPSGG